jgi:hypothetical protein
MSIFLYLRAGKNTELSAQGERKHDVGVFQQDFCTGFAVAG